MLWQFNNGIVLHKYKLYTIQLSDIMNFGAHCILLGNVGPVCFYFIK